MRHAVKRGFLTAAFGAATAGLLLTMAPAGMLLAFSPLAAGLGYATLYNLADLLPVELHEGTPLPLSAGEIKLVKSVFGRKLADADIKKVRKYFEPLRIEGKECVVGAVFNRRVVKFYVMGQHDEDYSNAWSWDFGVFMHEMTHIWQRTNIMADVLRRFFIRTKQYDYKLTERSRFTFFGKEQQASIMEDYALRFLYPRGPMPARRIAETPENDALLQRVVERKFPAARQARLAVAEQRKKAAISKLKPAVW